MKMFRRGAHRSRRPADTLARIAPVARALGVTRLADVTGLAAPDEVLNRIFANFCIGK